jgi:hypothetical protein
MEKTTIEPVTVGGWYEHSDGTVGRYSWHEGQLRLNETVPSWADVQSDSDRLAADDAAFRASANVDPA